MAKIETEVLLAQAVEAELEKLAAEGGFEVVCCGVCGAWDR